MGKKPIHPLQRLRKRYGLTGAMVARLLGVKPGNIGMYESGFKPFPQTLVPLISKHFDIPEEEFRAELEEFEHDLGKYSVEKLQSAK